MYLTSFYNYLEYEKRSSVHTLSAYRSDMDQFGQFLERAYQLSDIHLADHGHIRSWIVELMDKGLQARSVNRKLSTLKTYFRFLRRQGHTSEDPFKKVPAPKTGKRLPATVRPEQMDRLLDEVTFPDSYAGTRDHFMLEMLYGTGMRRSELAQLPVSAIDLTERQIRVMGKRKKERLIPFSARLARHIENYLLARTAHAPEGLEPNLILTDKGKAMRPQQLYTIVRKYLSLVTMQEQRSPHVLRHSFATHLSDGGADINAIKELLGHSSLAATQIYTHNSIEKLRAVYAQAHPKAKEPPVE